MVKGVLKAAVMLGLALTGTVGAQAPAVDVGEASRLRKLVPAQVLEQTALDQYRALLARAQEAGRLVPPEDPRAQRLRSIASDLLPHVEQWNPDARRWRWEVSLIDQPVINAFCMPGGKIAFFTGIIDQLKLTDDEIAVIMGHEMAHALREHARERVAKEQLTGLGASLVAGLLGLGDLGRSALGAGAQLMTLKFSRDDEVEADRVGLEISSRAGYHPRAGVSLWRKMQAAQKGAPPQWLSTHPSGDRRIQEMQALQEQLMPLYRQAPQRSR
ncbi:HtpX Zn-dependent protease with chaperone function [Burkholderiales bacterium]